ncbi:MAG TPA: hypothetical protein VFX50_09560 [Gemmatimonadales bacterium]|nr:hypothetical protein [Gemmatimonadales bacterium]
MSGRTPVVTGSAGMARLAVIRIAMLAGVLTFGGVAFFVRRGANPPALAADTSVLQLAGSLIWAVAIIGVLVLFMLLRGRDTPERRASFSIIGWALGEAVALYGAVFLYLTGDAQWFLMGLTAQLLTFFIFPLRRR